MMRAFYSAFRVHHSSLYSQFCHKGAGEDGTENGAFFAAQDAEGDETNGIHSQSHDNADEGESELGNTSHDEDNNGR